MWASWWPEAAREKPPLGRLVRHPAPPVLTVPLTHGGEGSSTGTTHSSSGRREEEDADQEEEGRERKKGTDMSVCTYLSSIVV